MPGGKLLAPFHRPILTQAWQSAWRHKQLWLFGLFAGIANSGSVFQIVSRAFGSHALHAGLRGYLENSLQGATTLFAYVQKLGISSGTRLTITVSCILLGLGILSILAVCGQAELVGAIPAYDHKKKIPSFFARTFHEMGKVVAIDLIFRAGLIVLALCATALFASIHTGSVAGDSMLTFAVLILFLPIALIMSYLSVFSVIEVIAKKKTVAGAITASWQVLIRHWLPITELAALLFLVNFAFSAAIGAAILLFSVPYLLLLRGAVLIGSGFLWISTIAFGSITLCILVLALFGFATAFTYAAWYHAYERFGKTSTIASKLERFITHLRCVHRPSLH